MRRVVAMVVALSCGACVPATQYVPQVTARGELTLRYRDGFEAWAHGQRVSRGPAWAGLSSYVRCVEAAKVDADGAVRSGQAALGLSVLGGTLGLASLGALVAAGVDPDRGHLLPWLSGGVVGAGIGAIFSGVGYREKARANGRAVDALNKYNDAVGSLGATCADRVYPPPVGPLPGTELDDPSSPDGR